MQKNKKDSTFTLRLSKQVKQRLEILAEFYGITQASLICRLIDGHYNMQKNIGKIKKCIDNENE